MKLTLCKAKTITATSTCGVISTELLTLAPVSFVVVEMTFFNLLRQVGKGRDGACLLKHRSKPECKGAKEEDDCRQVCNWVYKAGAAL